MHVDQEQRDSEQEEENEEIRGACLPSSLSSASANGGGLGMGGRCLAGIQGGLLNNFARRALRFQLYLAKCRFILLKVLQQQIR